MKPQRSLAAAGVLALALTGCHHRQVVYTPPLPTPPPGYHPAGADTAERAPAPILRSTPQPEPPADDHLRVLSTETGTASWYGPPYNHHAAADGTIYDQNAMTAAHRTLPLGTLVRVTNLSTGLSATVRINDRGPFVPGRIIDLSLAAAKTTGLYRMGIAKVKVEVLQFPPRMDTEGRWCVQIGSFSHESDALKLKSNLLRRYNTAKVIDFPSPVGGYWVRITLANPDRTRSAQVAENIHPTDPAANPYLVRTN